MAFIPAYRPVVARDNWANPNVSRVIPWGDFLAESTKVPAQHRIRCDHDWNGVRSWDEGVSLASRGWADGMAHVRSVSLPAVKQLVARRPVGNTWGWDVTGADYDTGEYLSGVPECCQTPTVEDQKPVVRLMVNLTTSRGCPQEIITMRGAGVVALTLALQASGYVVDVSGLVGVAPDYRKSIWYRIPLCDANGGPLDVDRLVYALAHPSCPRLFGYSLAHAECGTDPNKGFTGWAQHAPEWETDLWLGHAGYGDADWSNASAVSKWVQREYDRLTAGEGA